LTFTKQEAGKELLSILWSRPRHTPLVVSRWALKPHCPCDLQQALSLLVPQFLVPVWAKIKTGKALVLYLALESSQVESLLSDLVWGCVPWALRTRDCPHTGGWESFCPTESLAALSGCGHQATPETISRRGRSHHVPSTSCGQSAFYPPATFISSFAHWEPSRRSKQRPIFVNKQLGSSSRLLQVSRLLPPGGTCLHVPWP
jgi:hypothetical protein